MVENNKQHLKLYKFQIPETWYSASPDLWIFDIGTALGPLGECIMEHEEWAMSDENWKWHCDILSTYSEGKATLTPHLVPWEELPTNMIDACRQQIVKFNKAVREDIGNLVLLDNGDIGKLQAATFRFFTDDERKRREPAKQPNIMQTFITVDVAVEIDARTAYYVDNAMGVRFIDRTKAIMPSFEMGNLARKIKQFIWQQESKIVSMEEWKKRKEKEKKSLTNHLD